MGDHAWKKFQTQMKEKRTKKKTNTDRGSGAGVILQCEDLIVQRLSAEVTGKAQNLVELDPGNLCRLLTMKTSQLQT